MLEKRGAKRTDQLELSELCFNSIVQPGGRGSASERFRKRSPKTLLPGTMDDHVNHLEMVKRRHEHQVNLSLKKGRTSVDEFLPGDRVLIQDNNSGKWLEEGTINLARRADDQSIQSYEIKMSNGTIKLRNKRFIKHLTKEKRQIKLEPDNSGDHTNQEVSRHEAILSSFAQYLNVYSNIKSHLAIQARRSCF